MSFYEIDYSENKKSWNMPQVHSHSFFEIYCLLEGERNFFLENKIYVLREPSIIIVPPFYMHKTEGKANINVNLLISSDALTPDEDQFLRSFTEPITIEGNTESEQLFFALLKEFSSNKKAMALNEEYAFCFIKTMLYFLRTAKIKPLENSTISPSHKTDALIFKVVQYISKHYAERLTLEFLSDMFFISKNSLGRRFNKVMNCSVIDYLSKVRFSESKKLLLTTNKPISEIASLCGFSSANYYSLIFKKNLGISPQNYRNRNKRH